MLLGALKGSLGTPKGTYVCRSPKVFLGGPRGLLEAPYWLIALPTAAVIGPGERVGVGEVRDFELGIGCDRLGCIWPTQSTRHTNHLCGLW